MTKEERYQSIKELFFKSGLTDEDGHMTVFGYYYASETFGQAVANKLKRIFWPQGAFVLNVSKQEDVKAFAEGIELPKDEKHWNLLWWSDVTDDMYKNLIELFGITVGRWSHTNAYFAMIQRKFEQLTKGQVKPSMVIKEFFTDDSDFEAVWGNLQYDFSSPEWTELKL